MIMTDDETKSKSASETAPLPEPDSTAASLLNEKRVDTKTTAQSSEKQKEYGGRSGPNPTRYGDWENKGRCVDF